MFSASDIMRYILGALAASLLFTGSMCAALRSPHHNRLNKRCLCTDASFHFNDTVINLIPVLALMHYEQAKKGYANFFKHLLNNLNNSVYR